MRSLNYFMLPGLTLVSITQAMANSPAYLNSNTLDNLLPTPNLPAEEYNIKSSAPALPQEQNQSLASNTVLMLDNILIEGGTVYPFAEIAGMFSPLIGRNVTLGQLATLTNRITKRYQDDGFALSYAVIPDQDLRFGEVRIILVEGYIAKHDMQGDIGKVEGYISKMAAKIINERPLRKESFERYTTLMSQVPGVKLRANVAPPTTTDGAVTLITKAEREPFAVSASLISSSKDGTKALLSATSNSQTALGEQVTVSTIVPQGKDKERYARVGYSQFVGDEGTRVNASVSGFRSEPSASSSVNIENVPIMLTSKGERKNDRISVGVTHPFIASPTESLTGTASVYGVNDVITGDNVYSSSNGQVASNLRVASKIRALALESEWKQADQTQLRIVSGGVYQGLDILGAESTVSEVISNTGAKASISPNDIDFFRARLSGMQTNVFASNWQSVWSGAAYWSADNLPQSEQVLFGDRNFGRGYPAEQAYGDKGWGLGYELGYSFYPGQPWLQMLQPYAALDAARTWFNADGKEGSTLSSYALGVRFGDRRYYNMALEFAQPLGDAAIYDNGYNRDPKLNFSLNYNL